MALSYTPQFTYKATVITDVDTTLPDEPILWAELTNNDVEPVKLFNGAITLRTGEKLTLRNITVNVTKVNPFNADLFMSKNRPNSLINISVLYAVPFTE
jgi:hypothetical protein